MSRPEHELHEIEVVGGQIDRDAGVLDPRGSGPTRVAWARKTLTEAALGDQLAQLRRRPG